MTKSKTSQKPIMVFKYGGNAMLNEQLKTEIITNLIDLKSTGVDIVIVHGGGPFIKEMLLTAKVESEFIDGHRVTTPEALKFVEMALKGNVNGDLVRLFNKHGQSAVGLSGKDGQTVIAEKRFHKTEGEERDLGRVGNVKSVNTSLLNMLLKADYLPVITCLASDESGSDYNINADMFAGHIAGALNAEQLIVMTDVDGLMTDINNPDSLLSEVNGTRIAELQQNKTIKGGMIPKIEACTVALEKGARAARIINGTKPQQIKQQASENKPGTLIQL